METSRFRFVGCLDVRSCMSEQHKQVGEWNTKGGSIIVPLTSCLTGLESAV
jgi:hypothetical protein